MSNGPWFVGGAGAGRAADAGEPEGPTGSAAGSDGFLAALDALDGAGDRWFGRWRGRPGVDNAAGAVSTLADYGLVWVVLAALKARRAGPGRARAVLALALAGVSSYGVNRVVKSAVRRERPDAEGADAGPVATPGAVPVRAPTSTSFPSGHTLAAFCAAATIPETTAGVVTATTFAGAVAASRVHLRAHHLSDVVAGAALGSVLGLVMRSLLRRLPRPRR